jgi:hypothetical protein
MTSCVRHLSNVFLRLIATETQTGSKRTTRNTQDLISAYRELVDRRSKSLCDAIATTKETRATMKIAKLWLFAIALGVLNVAFADVHKECYQDTGDGLYLRVEYKDIGGKRSLFVNYNLKEYQGMIQKDGKIWLTARDNEHDTLFNGVIGLTGNRDRKLALNGTLFLKDGIAVELAGNIAQCFDSN